MGLTDTFGLSSEELSDKLADGREMIKALLEFNRTGKRPKVEGKAVRKRRINGALDLWQNGEFFPGVATADFTADEISLAPALTGLPSTAGVSALSAYGVASFNTFISMENSDRDSG